MGLQQRAHRALARQLAYQEKKANSIRGREQDLISAMMHSSAKVRALASEFPNGWRAANILKLKTW
jgi:hypothetical protein